jgi:sugar phosphate permease
LAEVPGHGLRPLSDHFNWNGCGGLRTGVLPQFLEQASDHLVRGQRGNEIRFLLP